MPRGNIRGEVPAVIRRAQPEAGLLQPDTLHLSQPVRGAAAERPVLGEQLLQQPGLLQPTQAGVCAERHGLGEQLHLQSPLLQHRRPDKLGLRQPSRAKAHAQGPGPKESSQEGRAGRCTAQEQSHLQSPWQAESEADLEGGLVGHGIWQPDVWEHNWEADEAQGQDVGGDYWHEAPGMTGTAGGAHGLTGRDILRGQGSRLQGGASRAGASRGQT